MQLKMQCGDVNRTRIYEVSSQQQAEDIVWSMFSEDDNPLNAESGITLDERATFMVDGGGVAWQITLTESVTVS